MSDALCNVCAPRCLHTVDVPCKAPAFTALFCYGMDYPYYCVLVLFSTYVV